VIDFTFIHELTAPLYKVNNRHLFGVRSERQLVREIQVNVAYRWFLRQRLMGLRCLDAVAEPASALW